MKEPVQVTILGQQYTLRSDAPAVHVRKVAAFVNEKIAEVMRGRAVDTHDALVLALMNVAGAYLDQKGACGEDAKEVDGRLRQLLERLESECPICE